MDDFIVVEVFETEDDAGNEETGFVFLELSAVANVVPHVSTVTVVHDKKQLLSALEGVDHVHEEGMVEPLKQLLLIHHRVY